MVRRLIAVLGLGSLLAAAPASADLRADYVNERGMVVTIVELDDNGQARIGNDQRGYYLATTDGEFFVEPGPGGPVAISLEASAWLARGRPARVPQNDAPNWHYEPTEKVQIGNREGQEYRLVGENVPAHLAPIVISTDPALARIGLAMMNQSRAFQVRNGWPVTVDRYTALMLKGAVLAGANRKLGPVSFDPIPSERFQLPVAPVTLADVQAVWPIAPPNAEREGARPPVVQAAFWNHALWTLDDSGRVTRIPEGMQDGAAVDIPAPATALCRGPQGLWLVTAAGEQAIRLWLRNTAGGWDTHGEIAMPSAPSPVFGVECSGERPLLFLGDQVVEAGGRTFQLAGAEQARSLRGYVTLLRVNDTLYVGLNAGEWGGGIHRIALPHDGPDGLVVELEPLCDTARPEACRAVTGLAADPARPECLLASLGLVHFFPSGEVVRVCGTSVQGLYRKPYTIKTEWSDDDVEPGLGTVPFFALAGGDGEAWAVAADGVYRFREGQPEVHTFPPVRATAIDWSYPGIVLVPTTMNQRHSLSGGSLLLALRQGR